MENLSENTATGYEAFKETWINEILVDNPTSVQKGNRFARKLLSQWLDFNQDSDEIIFCDGAGDGGIDVAYLQRSDLEEENTPEGDTWYLIQSKYGKAFSGTDTEPNNLSEAIFKVLEDTDSEAAKNLYNSALQVIDEYMTQGMENSVYTEPKYTGDSNAFLKDAKLGKSDDVSPKLINLIALQKQLLRRPMGAHPAMSEAIVRTIRNQL